MDKTNDKLGRIAAELGVGGYQRHVLLCVGPDCCTEKEGQASWDELKQELKQKGLSLSTGPNACYRTKVGCLRVCDSGPIAVVYPEGTWYSEMTADRIPTLVQKHLIEGTPIVEWSFASNPLTATNETNQVHSPPGPHASRQNRE